MHRSLSAWSGLAACAVLAGVAVADPITNYAIYGATGVQIGVGSSVTGLVGTGNGIVTVGDATLNGTAQIFGDLRAGDAVSLANNVHVTGTVTNPGSFSVGAGSTVGSHVVAMPTLPNLPAATAYVAGITNQSVGNGGTMNLAPGSWNDVTLGGSCVLNLTAGVYYLHSLTAGNGLDLNVNVTGGPVTVYVVDDVVMGSTCDVVITGGAAGLFNVETHSSSVNAFRAGGGVNWRGNIFTPNGGIHLGAGSGTGGWVGYLWAGTVVDIEHGLDGSVPSPGAAVLAGVAGLTVACRRRR
ncbi:MAG: hypothetical protein ACREJO_05995 [Phycisphaerales bacterium]